MREILFRGKRTDNSEWVEGFLHIKYFQEVPRDRYVIEYETEPTKEWKPKYMVAEVFPETIGPYTGLTAKNGTKIFEGDILKYKSIKNENRISYVMYANGCFCVKNIYSENRPAIDIVLFETKNNVEVIGNIHDNPELLKGGDKE